MLKAEELSAKKGIPRSTLYWLAKTGQIPAIYYGARAVRFDEDLVEDWLKRQTKMPR